MKRIAYSLAVLCTCSLLFVACQEKKKEVSTTGTAFNEPPSWAKDQIWYQIFVESFRNGDASNDPTPVDLVGAHPGFVPEGWHVTPWGHDWYKAEDYAKHVIGKVDPSGWEMKNFGSWSQIRRYGGDLQGVMDKIAYLDSLGITAIYFNPLNDAPSNHKYDAANYRHIDRNFGPNPAADRATMSAETPQDPSTWKFTEADKLFLEVIKECHKRDIKVVMDYSWNHTGCQFWAWKDLVKNQSKSEFKDWYRIETFDDPTTEENEFTYHGWANLKTLPELDKTVHVDQTKRVQYYEGDYASQAAKNHIFAVTRKWLDPNGDGDTSDGVDGYRMDVAVEIPFGFWRDFRKVVRGVNPDAYLVAECWWEKYPDGLIDPAPFLQGDMFDAVMNYRTYRAERGFFAQTPDQPNAEAFVDSLNSFLNGFSLANSYAMMNVNGTHDTPRLLTSLDNNDRKYKVECEWTPLNNYKVGKPSERAHIDARLLLAMQFTYIGAPHIWMGDEMGMWGADMASSRKPLLWEDYTFEPETVLDAKHTMEPVTPVLNHKVFDYYKKLTTIRKQHPVLRSGKIKYLLADDERKVVAYSRYGVAEKVVTPSELKLLTAQDARKDEVIAAFNKGDKEQTITLPTRSSGYYQDLLQQGFTINRLNETSLEVALPAQSVVLLSVNSTHVVAKGQLDIYRAFPSKLVTPRDLFVWMPEQYDPNKRYPVVYMHDGQMLWDAQATWNKQEWMIDEEMQRFIDEGKVPACIVVGTSAVAGDRFFDYYPQKTNDYLLPADSVALNKVSKQKFSADNYLKFLVEEIKPFVDSHYATKVDAENTTVMGSSMGGLISLYAICEYPEVFSRAACMSTHTVMITPALCDLNDSPRFAAAFRKYLTEHLPKADGTHRIYLDRGDQTLDAEYPDYQDALDKLMVDNGWKAPFFKTKVFPGHAHMEADWCKRLEEPFTFLLSK